MIQIVEAYGGPLFLFQLDVQQDESEGHHSGWWTDRMPLTVIAGVLQGDTLAPFLFIIVLDYALRQATKLSVVERD